VPACFVSTFRGQRTATPFRRVQTLGKLARALEIPLYQFFYEGKRDAALDLRERTDGSIWGANRKDIRFGERLGHLLARMGESERRLLLRMAEKMARR
jgi:hypothetical protein